MRTASIAAILAVIAPVGHAVAQPSSSPYWLGEGHGPHMTGTTEELWVDDSRDEPTTTDPNDKRRMMIRTWYPADFPADATRAPYVLDVDLYQDSIREGVAEIGTRATRSVVDAHVERGSTRYPVLIYNSGGGWPEFSATFLTEYLASYGYVVVSIGHTGFNGPHQGGWVELKSGESWFIHFQDRRAYGRIVHLQPVKWIDDWPVIGNDADGDGKGEPVIRHRKPNVGREYPVQAPQTSDEFAQNKLGLQWQWHANPLDDWLSLATRRGWLRLKAVSRPAFRRSGRRRYR